MQKSYFSFVFDFLFYAFVVFLITFVWVRMLVHNTILIWTYSISITLIISILLFSLFKKKIYKFSYSKKERSEKQKILNNLIFAQNDEIVNFLVQFFDEFEIKKHREFFVLSNKSSGEKYIVFFSFRLENVGCDKLIEFIKKAEKERISKVYVFCSLFDKTCQKFCKNLKETKIKIVDFDNFYENYIKKHNIKPNFKEKYAEKNKYSFK
ncbi:MAG: hypothetical protein ACI4TI_03765, partial [Christensenellales bacterium]